MARLLAALLILFTFVSCNKTKSMLPNSGGKAFEVVLINDNNRLKDYHNKSPHSPLCTTKHNNLKAL